MNTEENVEVDYANYLYIYSFSTVEKEMFFSDRVRMDVYFNDIFENKHCFKNKGEKDDKIIAVCADDPEYKHFSDYKELAPHRIMEIRRFLMGNGE